MASLKIIRKFTIMKYIALILILFSVNLSAQTYLKVADKPEYALYEKWCKDSIFVDIIQYGKATVINPSIPGLDYQLYKAVDGLYSPSLLKDTFWYQPWRQGVKTTAISLNSDQVLLKKKIRIKIQRYKPSVAHYYLIRDQYRTLWQNL
jgi:hypothetical protein